MRILLVILACLVGTCSAARADLVTRGNQAVLAWRDAAKAFAVAAEAACQAQAGPAAMAAARDAFATLAIRWEETRPWLVGPAVARDLASAVWFWPDPHGSAGRQIGKALAQGAPQGLASTGLGLAEAVLFDRSQSGETAPGAKACAMLREVGRVQADLAASTVEPFTTTRLSSADRRRLLFVSMRDTLDRISQEKIARPLGLDIDTARGQRAEAWRSGLSMRLVGAALDGMAAIYRRPDGMEVQVRDTDGGLELDLMFLDQLERTRAAVADVTLPLDQAVTEPAGRQAVEALLKEVQQLRLLLVERLAPALGQTLGFNALDGD